MIRLTDSQGLSLEMLAHLKKKLVPNCQCNQVAIYTGDGSQLEWKMTGPLPTPRYELRATVIENYIYVTGGHHDGDLNDLTEVLRWDPSSESWQLVGNLGFGRYDHAVVAIPSSIIESECSEMFLK